MNAYLLVLSQLSLSPKHQSALRVWVKCSQYEVSLCDSLYVKCVSQQIHVMWDNLHAQVLATCKVGRLQ